MKKNIPRPVEVKYRDVKYKGVFHGWSEIIYDEINEDQVYHFYLVGVIENSNTGEVCELSPENFRFLDSSG